MRFRITLQRTPFAHTRPSFDTVEAKDRVGAFLAAYNRHSGQGLYTHSSLLPRAKDSGGYGQIFNDAEVARLKAAGVPDDGYPHDLYILHIEPIVEVKEPDEAPQRPTVIDGAEVFNDSGALALTINDWDMLILSVCSAPNPDEHPGEVRPTLTDAQHQAIIDVIVKALGVDKPKKR